MTKKFLSTNIRTLTKHRFLLAVFRIWQFIIFLYYCRVLFFDYFRDLFFKDLSVPPLKPSRFRGTTQNTLAPKLQNSRDSHNIFKMNIR